MNQAQINILKQVAAEANAAYNIKKDELTAAGVKSQDRYTMLKDLKAAADKAHAEYSKYARGQINRDLVKIIEADRPNREAAARARSAWKQAKFDAAK